MKLDETGLKYVLSLLKVRTPKQIYPVGSIYMSVNSTDPANLFGGTWEQIQDTFLLASGTTYTAGATGGEATHTLTTEEMPSHTHAFTYVAFGGDSGTLHYETGGAISGSGSKYAYLDGSATNRYPSGTKSTGSGNAHNNMPPYLAVYVWKRIA